MRWSTLSKWRWPVDAEKPDDDGKPCAKVIPFASGTTPASQPGNAGEVPSAEWVKSFIAEAFDESTLARMAQQDQVALDDELAFHRRFGFTVNRSRRKKVVDFKHAADLTDQEIRLLWRTANLDLNGEKARISATNLAEAWGYVQIAALCLLMVFGFWAALYVGEASLRQLVALSLFEFVLVGLLSAVNWMYVRPNQIRRRIAREEASRKEQYIQPE